jgi:trimethylamine--corrinoid protein Co-methyltransferase
VLEGFTRRFRPLELLSAEEVESIHRGTLAVLRQTGVRFDSDWALDVLTRGGCDVNMEEKRVRFPEGLVEECLRKCPSSFRVKARNPKNDVIWGGDTVHFGQAAGMQTIDLESMQPRTPTREEFIAWVRVMDALPNLHWIVNYPYFGFAGVPPVMAITEGLALKLKHSSKQMAEGYSRDCEVFNLRMVQAVGGELWQGPGSQSPLSWSEDALTLVRRTIEAGFPVSTGDGNTYGATAPATLAGSLIVCNAELISLIVLVQLVHPGHRVRAGHVAFPQDMRSGFPAFGDIACSISCAMFNQMWRRYRVPTLNSSPGYISSKSIDFQAGYEKALGAITSALSGASMILLHGGVSAELTAHPVQGILDDDVAGMVGRFLQGADVTDETMALELIDQVGPVPGHYLNQAHTRKWWRHEQYVPSAADRLPYAEWLKTGKKKAIDYARERMDEILATHEPDPLTAGQEQALVEILAEARAYYRGKGMISDKEWAQYMRALEAS